MQILILCLTFLATILAACAPAPATPTPAPTSTPTPTFKGISPTATIPPAKPALLSGLTFSQAIEHLRNYAASQGIANASFAGEARATRVDAQGKADWLLLTLCSATAGKEVSYFNGRYIVEDLDYVCVAFASLDTPQIVALNGDIWAYALSVGMPVAAEFKPGVGSGSWRFQVGERETYREWFVDPGSGQKLKP